MQRKNLILAAGKGYSEEKRKTKRTFMSLCILYSMLLKIEHTNLSKVPANSSNQTKNPSYNLVVQQMSKGLSKFSCLKKLTN